MIYHLHVPINSKTRLFCMYSIITSNSSNSSNSKSCALILFIQTLALYKSFTYLLTYSHPSHLSQHSSHRCVSYCIVYNVYVLYQFYASFISTQLNFIVNRLEAQTRTKKKRKKRKKSQKNTKTHTQMCTESQSHV